MAAGSYVPDEGDIIWVDFDPRIGHEQAGFRPAVVLSSGSYNRILGLLVCCPMTTKTKKYSLEVTIDGSVASVVLADQIRNINWRQRNVRYKGKVTAKELADIREKATTLINNITDANLKF